MSVLNEESRNSLIAQGRRGEKEKTDGKSRFEKRLKSRFSTSVKEYNSIDMNSVFKNSILTIGIPVNGETDNYVVRIKFGGFMDQLQQETKRLGKVDLRTIVRALVEAFNRDDVYISCNCADFRYRFAYWTTVHSITSGDPENRPSNITNPKDDKGPGCKHIMLVLSNTQWIMKVGSVINNYIKYMERNRKNDYAKYIYPALYGEEYKEPVQLSLYDSDTGELDTSKSTVDASNEYGRTSTRFKPGNPYRYQKDDSSPLKGQVSIEDTSEEEV